MKQLPVTPSKQELGWGLGYLAFELTVLPVLLVPVNLLLPRPLSEAQLNLVFFSVNFLAVVWILRGYLRAMSAVPLRRVLPALVWALVANWSMNFFLSGLIYGLLPDFFNVNDQSITQMLQSEFVVSMVGTVILAPPAEELLFRGLLFGSLYNRKPWVAYLVSVAAFCCVHVVGYIGLYEPWMLGICLVQYIPSGIALAWAYAHSGTLLTPILMHTLLNAISVAAMR